MSQTSISNLHKAMQGRDTIDGWDVLVSYSANKLNSFLKDAWNSNGNVTNVTIHVTTATPSHHYTTVFNLNLLDPHLDFDIFSANGNAVLKIDIADGQYWDNADDKKKSTISKKKFYIEARFPLAAINPQGVKFEDTSKIFSFDEGGRDAKYYVVFHFANIGATWKVKGNTEQDETGYDWDQISSVAEGLKAYFARLTQKDHIDLSIAEVSNTRLTDASDLLTPKSFMIGSQPGVLNVFIQTIGSGRNPGSDARLFKTGSNDYTPIPKDYGASIIISRFLFVEKFLMPAIKTAIAKPDPTFGNITSDYTNRADGGVDINLYFDKAYTLIPKGEWRYGGDYMHIAEEIKISSSKEGSTLALSMFDNGDLSTIYQWGYNLNKSAYWYELNGFTLTKAVEGHIHLSFATTTYEHVSNDTANDKINFQSSLTKLSQPYIIFHEPKTTKEKPLDSKGAFPQPPSVPWPQIPITLPALDYFKSTNIFAPGRHMIDAKGIMFPWDLVILGDVAAPKGK